jgi:hypothetical protein
MAGRSPISAIQASSAITSCAVPNESQLIPGKAVCLSITAHSAQKRLSSESHRQSVAFELRPQLLSDKRDGFASDLFRDDPGIEDDAVGPYSNVLRLSGRRGTDPRIPLQEAFSSQLFRTPLGRTSRTALARRKSGPHETLAQLSQQLLQRALEIQCVSRMSEMRCASWDDSLVQRLTRRLTRRRTRV